jgi:hypothetical protein
VLVGDRPRNEIELREHGFGRLDDGERPVVRVEVVLVLGVRVDLTTRAESSGEECVRNAFLSPQVAPRWLK